MSKTTAPLLSFGASGGLAKTMVYSTWRGIPYVRRHVIPANPQTTAQQTVRKTFALLREMWKLAPADLVAPWNAFAQGRPFTGMNKFVGENVRVLKGQMNMDNFIASPGAKGGPPALSMVGDSGGVGEVTATLTPPPPPPGWTLVGAAAVAFPDQAPDGIFSGPIVVGTDNATPYAITLGGFTTGDDIQIGGWLVWTKPDGTTAYSVSIQDQAVAG